MANSMPLRYKICSLYQLPQCLSNNSVHLKIHVADIMDPHKLTGFKISVEHDTFGTLFAYIMKPKGELITDVIDSDLSIDAVLKQLEKFGFFIEYSRMYRLPPEQMDYLITVQRLRYDKLRVIHIPELTVMRAVEPKSYFVVFKCDKVPLWLDNLYNPSKEMFERALVSGDALNLTDVPNSDKFDWSWLTYVADIDSVLREQIQGDYPWQ